MKKAFASALLTIISITSLSADVFEDIGKGIKKAGKAVGKGAETIGKGIKKEMEPEIKSTTVTIGSGVKEPVNVIFQAVGCGGVVLAVWDPKFDTHYICKKVQLKGGQSYTYNWKWGQTNKKVQIGKIIGPVGFGGKLFDVDKTYSGNQLKQPILYGPTKEQVAQQEAEKKAKIEKEKAEKEAKEQAEREKLAAEMVRQMKLAK